MTKTPRIDHRGVPYRRFMEMFSPPKERFLAAIDRADTPVMIALINGGFVNPTEMLTPKISPRQSPGCSPYGDTGETLLHKVARAGNIDVALALVAHGADPNARTFFSETPLHTAARAGHERLVGLLALHGGDLTARASSRSTYVDDDPYCPTPIMLLNTAGLALSCDANDPALWLAQVARSDLSAHVSRPSAAQTKRKM